MLTKHAFILLSVASFSIISSCAVKTPPITPSRFSTGTCTLEQLEWNSVVEGFDQEKSLKILADLQGAATANPNPVTNDAKLSAELTASINSIIKTTNQKQFKVSQDVQDLMVKLRRLGCDMQAGLFAGNTSAAQAKYLELISAVDSTKKKLE